jgi:hypothetical protein
MLADVFQTSLEPGRTSRLQLDRQRDMLMVSIGAAEFHLKATRCHNRKSTSFLILSLARSRLVAHTLLSQTLPREPEAAEHE